MKKSILTIGNALNRKEQKQIQGGRDPFLDACTSSYNSCFAGPNHGCPQGETCELFYYNNYAHGVSWDSHEWLCVCSLGS